MSAETGVGPSMASGSQTSNGNWADLPIAPVKISTAPTQKVQCICCARRSRSPPSVKSAFRCVKETGSKATPGSPVRVCTVAASSPPTNFRTE